MASIFLGRIVKAFGIRGELKLNPSDDFWSDVLASKRIIMHSRDDGDVAEHAIEIERSRPHGASYVLKLAGVDDRNRAEELVGGELYVSEDDLDVALPDTLLPYQVVGLEVVDESGGHLGKVSSVLYSSAHDVYEVKRDGDTFMVPAVPEFVRSVDLDGGRIVVRPIPGLLGDA